MINPQKGYLHIPMIFSHIEQTQGNVNRWTLRSAQFIAKSHEESPNIKTMMFCQAVPMESIVGMECYGIQSRVWNP